MIRQARLENHENLMDRYGGQKQEEYYRLKNSGYYLPPINAPCVNREYLLGVKDGNYLNSLESDVFDYPYRLKIKKEVVYILLKRESTLPLGFNINNCPSVKWMINMLYLLKPDHTVFLPLDFLSDVASHRAQVDIWHEKFRLLISTHRQKLQEITIEVRNEIRLAYCEVAIERLKRLKKNYPFITIDLNNTIFQ